MDDVELSEYKDVRSRIAFVQDNLVYDPLDDIPGKFGTIDIVHFIEMLAKSTKLKTVSNILNTIASRMTDEFARLNEQSFSSDPIDELSSFFANSEKITFGDNQEIPIWANIANFVPREIDIVAAIFINYWGRVLNLDLKPLNRSRRISEYLRFGLEYFDQIPIEPFTDTEVQLSKSITPEELETAIEELDSKTKANIKTIAENVFQHSLENKNNFDTFTNGFVDSVKKEIVDERHLITDEIENKIAAAVDGITLKATQTLWSDRFKNSSNAFYTSSVALALLLIAVPFVLWFFNQPILDFISGTPALGENGKGPNNTNILVASQITRLIFISLPALAYFWFVRLVVRYAMRSMILMDDAAARQTMLTTYLHLVENDKDIRAERPLILEALFRRTPGHGADTIEPPNLTDVLNLKKGVTG